MKKGIVYFIQPSELVGTNRYKIGASRHPDFKRIKSYGIGTRIITINECYKPFVLENKLIEKFREKFELLCKNEWFVGNELDMLKVFFDEVIEHKTKMKNQEIDNEKNKTIVINETKVSNEIIDNEKNKTIVINETKVSNEIIDNEKNKTIVINETKVSNEVIENFMKSKNTSGFPYFCDRCGYKTDRKSSFISHLTRKTACSPKLTNITREYILLKNKIYIDVKTGKKIDKIDNLNEDLSDSNTFNIETGKYYCPYCSRNYTYKTALYGHIKNKCIAKNNLEEEKKLIYLERIVS